MAVLGIRSVSGSHVGQSLDRCVEHIAVAALRLDEARAGRGRLDLPPQSQDQNVDRAIKDVVYGAVGVTISRMCVEMLRAFAEAALSLSSSYQRFRKSVDACFSLP